MKQETKEFLQKLYDETRKDLEKFPGIKADRIASLFFKRGSFEESPLFKNLVELCDLLDVFRCKGTAKKMIRRRMIIDQCQHEMDLFPTDTIRMQLWEVVEVFIKECFARMRSEQGE